MCIRDRLSKPHPIVHYLHSSSIVFSTCEDAFIYFYCQYNQLSFCIFFAYLHSIYWTNVWQTSDLISLVLNRYWDGGIWPSIDLWITKTITYSYVADIGALDPTLGPLMSCFYSLVSAKRISHVGPPHNKTYNHVHNFLLLHIQIYRYNHYNIGWGFINRRVH